MPNNTVNIYNRGIHSHVCRLMPPCVCVCVCCWGGTQIPLFPIYVAGRSPHQHNNTHTHTFACPFAIRIVVSFPIVRRCGVVRAAYSSTGSIVSAGPFTCAVSRLLTVGCCCRMEEAAAAAAVEQRRCRGHATKRRQRRR